MTSPAAPGLTLVSPSPRLIRFGVFEADLQARELRRRGVKVRLPDQPFQILAVLLEHAGDVVTRDELRHRLWSADTFVELDLSLNSAVRKLREALGDCADHPRFVETLPRRGYRFIAPIEKPAAPLANQAVISAGPTAKSRGRDYRWWVAAALGMTAGLLLIMSSARGRDVPPHIRSIAVIPLINGTGDPGREYVADGLTDALITELTQLASVQVISQNSSTAYKYTGSTKGPAEIGRALKVDGLIEGRVTLSDGRLHVTAQLVDTRTGMNVWAQGYDASNLVALSGEIARAAVAATRK
jgi:TolB-like protein/DNA-binding winged helix-turn-helix (wHTH) protein